MRPAPPKHLIERLIARKVINALDIEEYCELRRLRLLAGTDLVRLQGVLRGKPSLRDLLQRFAPETIRALRTIGYDELVERADPETPTSPPTPAARAKPGSRGGRGTRVGAGTVLIKRERLVGEVTWLVMWRRWDLHVQVRRFPNSPEGHQDAKQFAQGMRDELERQLVADIRERDRRFQAERGLKGSPGTAYNGGR